MKFTAQSHGLQYKGEGITVTERADGTVIGYFFTYTPGGDPVWIMCVGKREGDTALLQAYVNEGGSMGDPDKLDMRIEIPWGEIELSINANGKLQIEFRPLEEMAPHGMDQWTYELEDIYASPIVVGDTVPPEEPQEPQEPKPRVRLTRELVGEPQELVVPLTGRMSKAPAEYTLHAVGAPITVDKVWVSGAPKEIHKYNPRITGIREDEVIPAGGSVTFRCEITGDWRQRSAAPEYIWYGLRVKGFGDVINMALEVEPA